MKIPIGAEYTFTVKVLEEDSFLPQDLTNMVSAKLVILPKASVSASDAVLVVDSDDTTSAVGYWSVNYNTQKTTTTTVEEKDDVTGIVTQSSTNIISVVGDFPIDTTESTTVEPDTPTAGTTRTTTVTDTVLAVNKGIITFVLKNTSSLSASVGDKVDGYYYKSGYKGAIVLKFSDRADMNVNIDSITATVLE